MNFCPHCGEKLQMDTRFCPHCGGAIHEAAPAAARPQPAASPQTHPNMTAAIYQYTTRGFSIKSLDGNRILLEKPGASFETGLFLVLLLLVFIGALIYLFLYFVFANRKSYTVTLILEPDGSVREIGDTWQVVERDRLSANRARYLGFGIFFAVLTGAALLISVIVALAPLQSGSTSSWGSSIGSAAAFFSALGVPSLGIAVFLIYQARKLKQKISAGIF